MPYALAGSIFNGITNAVVSGQNLKLQKEAFAAQQRENALTRQREDNATQRKVADLKAAGINPILASGQQAAATGVTVGQAPQNNFKSEIDASQVGMQTMALMKMKKELGIMDAQKNAIMAETRQKEASTNLISHQSNTESQKLQNLGIEYQNLQSSGEKLKTEVALNKIRQTSELVEQRLKGATAKEKEDLLPLIKKAKQLENDLQRKENSTFISDKVWKGFLDLGHLVRSVIPFTQGGTK